MDMEDGKNQQQSHAVNGFAQEPPTQRADIDEILRRKRKAREYKVWRIPRETITAIDILN